jgi:hypothetical protein
VEVRGWGFRGPMFYWRWRVESLICAFSFWLILQEVLELHLWCLHCCRAICGPSYLFEVSALRGSVRACVECAVLGEVGRDE